MICHSLQAAAPSVLQDCVPAYKSQAVPAIKNSTQFYDVFITLPDCFYGLVSLLLPACLVGLDGRDVHVCSTSFSHCDQLFRASKRCSAVEKLFLLQLPNCLVLLQVNVQFQGQVTNAAGYQSLPIKSVGYNRVASNIPVRGLSANVTLPALGENLLSTCS